MWVDDYGAFMQLLLVTMSPQGFIGQGNLSNSTIHEIAAIFPFFILSTQNVQGIPPKKQYCDL